MKTHTTNYKNTFIEVAEDCPVTKGEIPPVKDNKKSSANIQFELISENPYIFTSDDIIFHVFANKNKISEEEIKEAREYFFSKGQACFRASPLTKRYGWGIHHNEEGKIALFGCETNEYRKFSNDKNIKSVKAMRSSKK
ncbi:MAG: DUF6157 family protein [Bacteroidales bacterium]|jgi:hypothetical protein|nr:DUF6157 family protein [Bacteroidales bacterium]